ncbi:HAD family hydrolase [Xanthomarina spongicola]|uniref:Putative hydrolase of the HAD superfamily n=1 Tax=Xanthomarina spongicola TaxID=570520 RepID=A0A316DNI1_9FLAO|nr:HAD family phosphatase [Xanthomarina spongicola]PWK19495.1 putative hydrolase of the HAD superfamily [Xanthomarina spongicola]
MNKTLIFDFGDVFINLDKEGAMNHALDIFKLKTLSEELIAFNSLYEQGLISTEEFIEFYLENFPDLDEDDVLYAWNCILKDFPEHRLDFIKNLAKENTYNLILLSNTNELHIDWIKERVSFYEDFKNCFHKFYLSHEIQLRKPDASIYNFVLKENKLNPGDCLFIDDTIENIEAAAKLGIHTWNINPKTEDISNLFTIKKEFF